jgi:hypothetical protein
VQLLPQGRRMTPTRAPPLWTFKIAGTSRPLRAKITDKKFLANYTNGVIRFCAQDLLTAKVYEKQTLDGSKVKAQNKIIEA